MSDFILSIDNVSKDYKVFKRPLYRLFDAFGMTMPHSYEVFHALRDICLNISEGERVGFIGRNGAGKSTLLKVIAGLIQPSSGRIQINARVDALFELGTGFHPEFTGEENVYSSLSYHGVTGGRAKEAYQKILEFSELGQFMQRPVKTYSAGMYSRLAFSVSAIAIEYKKDRSILIIDEVLGAGDAYFSGKCVDKMKSLTQHGNTLLFVSHDISAVQMMCDRAIWIDKGKLLKDGNPIEVGKDYYASIREQENNRLELESVGLVDNNVDTESKILFRMVSEKENSKGIKVYDINFFMNNIQFASLDVGSVMDTKKAEGAYIINDNKVWRDFGKEEHRTFRTLDFQHSTADSAAYFAVNLFQFRDIQPIEMKVVADIAAGEQVQLEYYNEKKQAYCAISNFSKQHLQEGAYHFKLDLNDIKEQSETASESKYEYGSLKAKINQFRLCDENDQDKKVFLQGEAVFFKMDWQIEDRQFLDEITFVLTIYSADGKVVTQVLSEANVSQIKSGKGSTTIRFKPLLIGKGEYITSVGIYNKIDRKNNIGTEPIHVLDRKVKFKVYQPDGINIELGQIVHPVEWEIMETV